MKKTYMLLLMLAATAARAEDGVPFPGPAISHTTTTVSNRQAVIGNNTLTATFQRGGKSLRLAKLQSPLNDLDLPWSDSNLFSIYLTGKARPLSSSTMQLVGEAKESALVAQPDAARLSQRLPGRMLRATFGDEASGLSVQWKAVMTDGANYLRQEITLRATRGPVAIDRIEMVRANLPGAKVAGYTDGSPITTDKLFLGVEHPMAQNSVQASAVSCSLPRQCMLEPGAEWTVSSGIGVYPAGQLRRAFLCYLERERAHPYRQYWHYNSWYDLNIGRNDDPDPLKRMTEAQCLDVIRAFGRELYEKRGVGLDGFVWDDGWDDWNSLWGFHKGFPNGFAKLQEEAAKQGAGMGAWLSPWGGYGGSHDMRVKFGREKGYETNVGGFSLGGPKYRAVFRDVCLKMIRDYNMNYFKFDGIGGGMYATGAPASIAPDLDGLVRVLGDLRRANPEVFINCTTGTWASPYWTWFADSVWRQGDDCNYAGEGNARERWITYRDERLYARFAKPSPLYPLNSMMYHGLLVAARSTPAPMPKPAENLESYRHEVLMSVACGSGLGELYVTPGLMTPKAWDILAAGLKWNRARRDILRDAHWVGGNPLKEVYGYAAWHPQQGGTIVLRNPTGKTKTFALDVAKVLELPEGFAGKFTVASALDDTPAPVRKAEAGKATEIALAPFEVLVLDLQVQK